MLVWYTRPFGIVVLVSAFIIVFVVGSVDWDYAFSDLNQGISSTGTSVSALRLEKGLNNRDEIWNAALEMFSDRWLLGWGDISVVEEKLVNWYGAPTTAVQNGYIMIALRTGVVGLMIWLSILVLAISKYVEYVRVNREARLGGLSALAISVFVLVDNMFRTYSPGGVGFIPTMLLIAISYLLWVVKSQSWSRRNHAAAAAPGYWYR